MHKSGIIYVTFLLCLSSFTGFSQSRIRGTVYDKQTGLPLAGVTVMGYTRETLRQYTLTNEKGVFTLSFNDPEPYTHVLCTYMGYKPYTHPLSDDNKPFFIYMEEGSLQLKAVLVKPPAITRKKDTTIYDAAAFTRKGDNNISEVINRLPDISVTTRGTIKVQNRNIIRFYIENMDLLGGRYNIATRNIRPEDIAAIEVYHNHQPILALQEVEPSEQAAMNIRLKEKVKSKWLFSLGAAAGYGDSLLYKGNLNAMRFSRKNQNIFLLKANNNGEDIAMESRLQSLEPGVYKVEELSGLENNFSVSNRILPIRADHYYLNQTATGSVNTLQKLSSAADIKANINFITNRLKDYNTSLQVYDLQEQSEIRISEFTAGKMTTNQLTGEITLKQNLPDTYLNNKLYIEADWDSYTKEITNPDLRTGNRYHLPKLGISNKLSLIKNKNGRPLKFESLLNFYQANQQLDIRSGQPLPIFEKTEARQHYSLQTFRTEHTLSFSKKIKAFSISYRAGLKLNYEKLRSELTPSPDIENINTQNNISLFTAEPYLDGTFHYTTPTLRIRVSVPLGGRYDHVSGRHNLFFLYAPSFYLNYQFADNFTLMSTLSANNRLRGIKEYAAGFIFNNYRTAYAKDTPQHPSNQRYYLEIRYQDLLSRIGATVSADYTQSKNNVTTSEFFIGNTLFNSQIAGKHADKAGSVGINLIYATGIDFLTLKAGARYNTNRSSQFLQEQLYHYTTNGYTLEGSLSFAPAHYFHMDYNFNYTYAALKDKTQKVIKNYIHKVNMVISPWEKLTIRCGFEYYSQFSYLYEPSKLPFLNVHITYNTKKIKYFATFSNLINTREYVNTYFNGIATWYNKTTLRGREFMAGISWNL